MKEQKEEKKHTKKKRMRGVVMSDSMKDTVVVSVEQYVAHPKYGKYIRKRKRYVAHNPHGSAKQGQAVTIELCRPISKTKRFVVVEDSNKVDSK